MLLTGCILYDEISDRKEGVADTRNAHGMHRHLHMQMQMLKERKDRRESGGGIVGEEVLCIVWVLYWDCGRLVD